VGERVMSGIIQNAAEQPLNWEQRLSILLAKRGWIAPCILFAVAAAAVLPIFVYGFPRGSDSVLHYRWAHFFTESLREGVLYPRWLAGANHGRGSPVMNYYGPVPLYAVAAFNLLFHNTVRAMAMSCWLGLALSGLTMYIFSRSVLSRGVSLFAGLLYMLTAFHLFDLYQATALNEYWSFVWIPLVFDAIHRIAKGESWGGAAYLGLSYGLLLLTHVPIPFATTLILPIYVLILTRNAQRLSKVAVGLVLGVGISAMFLVPVLFERQYVKIDRALGRDYREFFLFRRTGLIWNTNLFSPAQSPYNGNYLVDATLVALGLAVLLAVSGFLLWRERKEEQRSRSGLAWRLAIWVVAAFSLFMTSRRSAFIWNAIPQLAYLQFPNRWLVITTAGTALITAAALFAITQARRRRLLYWSVFAIALLFNLVISAHEIVQAPYDSANFENKLQGKELPMYTPVWRDDDHKDELVNVPVEVASGSADVRTIDDTGSRQSYAVSAATPSELRFRQLYFPGWVVRLNERSIPLGPSKAGNVQVAIEPGQHELTLRFEDTAPRLVGKLISALSLASLAFIFHFTRLRKR